MEHFLLEHFPISIIVDDDCENNIEWAANGNVDILKCPKRLHEILIH